MAQINKKNILSVANPELAKEWHPTKNTKFTPDTITIGSHEPVWWYLPYDDPNTGKHFDFEWERSVNQRHGKKLKCPYLSGRAVWPGFNDLATIDPELCKEWHPTKNKITPQEVTACSHEEVYWYLPYDDPVTGKHFDFEWPAEISRRHAGKEKCPYLSGKRIWIGFNDFASVNPKLAAEWHPTKNGKLKPTDVTINYTKKVWWLYPYDDPNTGKHFDFEWDALISTRNNSDGCPFLTSHRVWTGFNDLATIDPELAKEWHPTLNGNLKPTEISASSPKEVWWLFSWINPKTQQYEEFEWPARIADRHINGNGCRHIKLSRNATFVSRMLRENNIDFVIEQKFEDLRNIKPLSFDFYINDTCLIEVDGSQHFKVNDYFGGEIEFYKTIKKDNMKNQYCADNNIPLLRIPYTYDSIENRDEIKKIVLNFVKSKIVPDEIKKFYSEFEFSNYVQCANLIEKIK